MNENTEVRYAGFWVRFLAYIFDNIIIGGIAATVTLIIFGVDNLFDGRASVFLWLLIGAIIVLSWVFMEGATPGKKIMGIKVVSYPYLGKITIGTAIIRCLSYVISYIILCLGFIMIAFREDKRGLHDLIAGTCVIQDKKEK